MAIVFDNILVLVSKQRFLGQIYNVFFFAFDKTIFVSEPFQ